MNWAELPEELWPTVGKFLDNGVDVVRFRSVCKPWRCFVPPFHAAALPLPPKFPGDFALNSVQLWQAKLYRVEPVPQEPPRPSSSSSKAWLVKAEESDSSSGVKLRLLSPISNCPLRDFPLDFAKVLNLLDFRVVELGKSCALEYFFDHSTEFHQADKVVLLSHSNSLAMLYNSQLCFAKLGDEKWNTVEGEDFHYDDIIYYKK